MIATKNSLEPQSGEPLPNSRRVYVFGKLHPEVRVPFRQIKLSPTKSYTGKVEANAPLRVYDCSGPWGDADFAGNVEQGLPPLRAKWILARADVEHVASSYKPIPGRSDATIPATLRHQPLHAKPGKAVTQLYYARQGIITPEMEFIAILRRRHPRLNHPRVCPVRNRPWPRHHPGQHQSPRERADDHRPQLPGEDQRQHR